MFEGLSQRTNKNHLKNSIITFLAISSLCFLAYFVSSDNSFKTPVDFQYNLELEEFRSFISKYSKDYKTEEEFYHRLRIFRDNLSYIRVFNSQGQTWYMGINQFSDLTHEEFNLAHKNKIIVPELPISDTTEKLAHPNLKMKRKWDWRQEGCVTQVLNEGNCDAPWAYTAVDAIASQYCVSGHNLVQLSVQEVIDCSGSYGNNGCNGGTITNVYKFAMKNGLTTEEIYPNTGKQGVCKTAKEKETIATISKYANVTPNNATALESVILQTPVSVTVEAIGAGWQNYKGGVISSNCGTSLDWAVLAIGYNLDNSPPYYICKNSWGDDWGEAGYVRVSIVDGAGTCGIQMSPSYPIF
ncbi:unnamed protein product [Blepharisma stoltei]|uniref:Uncharacterized protein n=1 Tax=Blepharisma stoltei TaxID=1481888 RepID=A0AAU9K2R2_9CILI|nr:unnamed protein product [Blepharisma stoltei]